MSLIAELKRRKVLRAAIGYAVFAWLMLQISDVITPIIDTPEWVVKLIFLLLLAGLPIALVLAWLFDLTNLGIYRERPLDGASSARNRQRLAASDRVTECFTCVWLALMGFGLSFGAASVIYLYQGRQIEQDYRRMAEAIAVEIEHCLAINSNALNTLSTLFINGQTPTFETFRGLTEILLAQHPELRAGEWVPRVPREELNNFIAAMDEVYPGYSIKIFDGEDKENPIEARAEYFPVSYTVPKTGNEMAIGYDLSSHPDRDAAMRAAAILGTARKSQTISLVQSGTPGFLLFHPVYADDLYPISEQARLETLRGFTSGVVDAERLINAAVASSTVAARFQGEIRIYERFGASLVPVTMLDRSEGRSLSSIQAHVENDTTFGPAWQVTVHPTQDSVAQRRGNEHLVVGTIGLALSITMALIVHLLFSSRSSPTPPPRSGSESGTDPALRPTIYLPHLKSNPHQQMDSWQK